MRAVGLALALLLVPAAAHAEEGLHRSGSKTSGARGHAGHIPRPTHRAPHASHAPRPHVAPTTLNIVPPRAATVLVDDGASVLSQVSTPSSIFVPSGKSYGITAMRGSKVLYRAQIAAVGGKLDIVWNRGPTPSIQHTRSAQPPPVVPLPIGPGPMAGHSFKQLVALVSAQDFESGKMEVVKTAAAHNHFTVAQVGRILDELTFDSSKVQALQMLRSQILDPENTFTLTRHFTFQSSQQQAMAMFTP